MIRLGLGCLILLCGQLSAQQIYFSNNQEIWPGGNFTGATLQVADSGYVYVTSNYSQPNLGYSFVKLDKNGDTVFTRSYIYSDRSFQLGVVTHSLIENESGNYIVCGNAIDTNNNTDGYLVAFDPLGDTLWTRRFSGTGSEYLSVIYQDSSNGYWLSGSTTSQGNGMSDFWLIRLDSNFTYLWDSVYGTSQSEGIVCADLTFDGGFIMSGRSANSPYIVKVDSNGAPQWQLMYSGFDGYGYVSLMPDSGYIVACNKILSATEDEGCLLKLSPTGGMQWYRYIGFVNFKEALGTKPLVLSGEIVVAGESRPQAGYYEGYLAKTDLNGNLLWQRRYVKGSIGHHYIYDLEPTNDHGFIMSGSCHIITQDAWLLKVDSLGCDSANCDGVGFMEHPLVGRILIFPNPASDQLTISSTNTAANTFIEILDATGKLLDQIPFQDNSMDLNCSSYAEGIYLVRIISEGECIATEKLIIAR